MINELSVCFHFLVLIELQHDNLTISAYSQYDPKQISTVFPCFAEINTLYTCSCSLFSILLIQHSMKYFSAEYCEVRMDYGSHDVNRF